VLTAIEGFVAELRGLGVPVSMSEGIDAVRSLTEINLRDREAFRVALAATLLKTQQHRPVFDTVFDFFFAPTRATGPRPVGPGGWDEHLSSLDDGALGELLAQALERDDEFGLPPLVSQLVDRHARIRPGEPVAGTFYVFRTFRAANPDGLRTRLAAPTTADPRDPTSPLRVRLRREAADRRVERLRQQIEAEVRRRLVSDRGAAAVVRSLRASLPEDVDFLTASTTEIEVVHEILAPLPGRLAAKLAEKRRHGRRGTIDFRGTFRKAMSTGGVPATPAFHRPRPVRPELIVLADISGSVATFARFTLLLAHAMRHQFRSVRSFAFVDGVDEVTDVLAGADTIIDVAQQIDERGSGVWLDGRSDYGNVLRTFNERWGPQVSTRSIVIVLGDARSNYRFASPESLAAIRRRAARVYWLNPEHQAAWGDGDSVIHEYLPHCDGVFECRNLRQLQHFIEQLD